MRRTRARYVLSFMGAIVLAAAGCSMQTPQSTNSGSTSSQPQSNPTAVPATPTPASARQDVSYQNGKLTLAGALYKPDGPGPFPAVVWNHGLEADPASGPDLDALANIFVPAGYVLFVPFPEGEGASQGQSLSDQLAAAKHSGGDAAAQKTFVKLMQGSQLDDQLAGLTFLKTQSFVDQTRLVAAGCGPGGVQALLGAAKGAGYKAVVAMSPGSDMWTGNTALQSALSSAAQKISVPVFLVQPDHDVTTGPSFTLGQLFLKANKAYSIYIVPPYGSAQEQTECFGGASGDHWWSGEVLTFMHEAFSPTDSLVNKSVIQTSLQGIDKQEISLQSDGLTLQGFVYKPQGNGPFPGAIWNHGSEQDPTGGEFDLIAELLVKHGYVLVAPVRRGQGKSQGTYIVDADNAEHKAKGAQAAAQQMVQLMTTEQLDDQMAGFNYLKSLPYVDPYRLVDIGCSYGGIQTILGAEANPGYKAAVAISPGAESWDGNKYLADRLTQAMGNLKIPIYVVQPAKDASLSPGFALGPALFKADKDHGLKIFPPFGPENQQGHCFDGGANGIWGQTVLNFFNYELKH